MTDNEFLARLCGDIAELDDMGYSPQEIIAELRTMDYVKEMCHPNRIDLKKAYPKFIRIEEKLPKGYKLADGKIYNKKGGKNSIAETYYFVPVGDDLYIQGTSHFLDIIKSDGKRRHLFLAVENYRDLSATKVRMGICGSKVMPFFENSLFDFYHTEGLRITDNAPVSDGLFPEYGKNDDKGLDVGFRVLKLVEE